MSAPRILPSPCARILVVDDNPAALYATSRVLRAAGYEVAQGGTGTAALEGAAAADLLVLDVNLPDIDGFEVCRLLRARPDTAQLPILHLSSTFTQAADFTMGLEAGADSYLTRPVESPVLLATVKTLLFARQSEILRQGIDARLAAVFQLAPAALAVLDTQLQYQSVNPAYCALSGYTAEELVGTALAPLLTLGTEDAAANCGQTRLMRKDGSTALVDWEMSTEPISRTHILVLTDVTHKYRLNEERENLLLSERAARAEAERNNRLMEEFLATLSHELRNPLNAILGWSTVLAHTQGLPEPVIRAAAAIERNSHIQTRMIADLLDYAGIVFGKLRLDVATIDPYPVVRAALEVVQSSATAEGMSIRSQFGDDDALVDADPGRLQQVVLNLLSNAVKFSRKHGQIDLRAARNGSNFELSVRDHGVGITTEFLPRIFERFSQQDPSRTRRHGGLGLGLAIVKQLLVLQGGTISAASDGPDQGATFVASLPLSRNSSISGPGESQTLRSLDLTGTIALVVEDDADLRELTKRILTDAGATVIEAADAATALELVRSAAPNVLISDIGMPGTDGYQLLVKLRAAGFGPARLPALALTAFARAQDRSDALAVGFQDHVVKPVDAAALIARVARLRSPRGSKVKV